MPTDVVPFTTRNLRKGVRLGVARRKDFKPIANLSFAADGGVMLAPVGVPGARWRYGSLESDRLVERGAYAEVSARPKLHYHASGQVAATLDGVPIPRRVAAYPPLVHLSSGSPLLSIVATRPWELASAEQRRGDFSTLESQWPWAIGFSFSILDVPDFAKTRIALVGGDRGLIAGDRHRAVFDLRQFGRQAILMAHLRVVDDPNRDAQASISMAAYPAVAEGESPRRAYGLWSSTAKNPALWREVEGERLSLTDLDPALAGPVRAWEVEERLAHRGRGLVTAQ